MTYGLLIFLVKSLSAALDLIKSELNTKVGSETATELEQRQYETLKYSASKPFIFYVVGALAEEIMKKRRSDLFEWKCRLDMISADNVSVQSAWNDALRALLPQVATILEQEGADAFYDVPRSNERSKQVAQKLRALIASLEPALGTQFASMRKRSTI